ncbi:MAG: hypothetical protein GY737_19705 [Desulfobacteraceae bacterium]|nr:hypothetical protein [Desulfobacteraceae bacterium]
MFVKFAQFEFELPVVVWRLEDLYELGESSHFADPAVVRLFYFAYEFGKNSHFRGDPFVRLASLQFELGISSHFVCCLEFDLHFWHFRVRFLLRKTHFV